MVTYSVHIKHTGISWHDVFELVKTFFIPRVIGR